MRVRTVSLVALAVAGIIAAIAIIVAPALSAATAPPAQPTPGAATQTLVASAASPSASPSATPVPRPTIVKKYIRYGDGRKQQTAAYCKRHYHQDTWVLKAPKAIVLHHTAGADWKSAWNLFDANTAYNNEKPGTSAQFIIGKDGTIYQLMRLDHRARHAIGMNWKSIGIEFVQEPRAGKDGHWMDQQILNRTKQVRAGLKLVRYLKARFKIAKTDIVGHAMANDSRFFKDYTGAKNAAGDWYKAETVKFRRRL